MAEVTDISKLICYYCGHATHNHTKVIKLPIGNKHSFVEAEKRCCDLCPCDDLVQIDDEGRTVIHIDG